MRRGKHQSLERSVRRGCRWIESLSDVSGLIIGRSESCRHRYSPGTIRVKAEIPAGLKLTAYAGFGVTDLVALVPSPSIPTVRAAIEARLSA
jgi:hypothetical protein